MHKASIVTTTRRDLLRLLGTGMAATWLPHEAFAQSRDSVLVVGMDIGDTRTYDIAMGQAHSPPVIYQACYDTLVTMSPGEYTEIKPGLATSWQRTPDGTGWRFTLREGVKFNSGNLMTVEDFKWSLDRVINMQGQPALYVVNIAETRVAGPNQLDIILKNPKQAILDILCTPAFSVLERKVAEAHGGVSTGDPKLDKAGPWLDQHSCGTGAYNLVGWERNSVVQLERNPHHWRGAPAFQRVVVRHYADPAAQLLAIQRGDIDVAFNLIPEQIEAVKQSKGVRVQKFESLDLIYIGLSSNPEYNKALAVREARQAIGWAIDYEGIKNNLLAGEARLPASCLPIGTVGSTPEVAKKVGYREDLDKAKAALAKAGYPDGFSFKLSYGNALVAGVRYGALALKIQSDLARVGIKVELDPLDPVTLRTQYNAGRSTAVLLYWNPPAVSNLLWGTAPVERLAKRLHYTPPPDIVDILNRATEEHDRQKEVDLWIQYQKRMAEEANLLMLFQPTYQIAARERIKSLPLTAAGWLLELRGVT